MAADTAISPFDSGTFSSRVTFYTGTAVKKAAAEAKAQLLEVASQIMEIPAHDLEVREQQIFSKTKPDLVLSFKAAMQVAHRNKKPILGKGWSGGKGNWPESIQKPEGKDPPLSWKYGAQAVRIKVDAETGIVRILKIVSAHDAGRVINPLTFDGQIIGGAVAGTGQALYENILFEDGRVTNPSFMDYKIPSAIEIPEVVPIRIDLPVPEGPFGAKGVGELAGLGISAAVANAICDAVRVRIKKLPLNPETVLGAIEAANV
jgi:CO/xanthine dehydrogenase Mo-binding subunit